MWEVDRTGDVAGDVRFAGARVDHDDRGKAGLEIVSHSTISRLTV